MSVTNSTDSSASLSNVTEYYQYYDTNHDDGTWTTRASEHWFELLCYLLGVISSLLVICLTLFSKKIVGDYKWFILNQGIANLFNSIGLFLTTLVLDIILGDYQFAMLYIGAGGSTPLWLVLFTEIIMNELQTKLGQYAQMTTLFATVFNRWVAIVFANQYQFFMTPRLIFVYCILCYLLLLPFDYRLLKYLPDTLKNLSYLAPYMLPWLLSIILSISLYIILSRHLHSMINTMDKRRLKESRNILYAIMIQIIIPLFDKITSYILLILSWWGIALTDEFMESNKIINVWLRINSINYLLSSVYTCLVILLTMRPYREALLSLMSPITKCCKRFIKQRRANEKSTTHATPVITIKSSGTKSEAITSSIVSSTRGPSQIVAVVS